MTDHDKKLIKIFKLTMLDVEPQSLPQEIVLSGIAYGWFRAKGAGRDKALMLTEEVVGKKFQSEH